MRIFFNGVDGVINEFDDDDDDEEESRGFISLGTKFLSRVAAIVDLALVSITGLVEDAGAKKLAMDFPFLGGSFFFASVTTDDDDDDADADAGDADDDDNNEYGAMTTMMMTTATA